MPNKPPLRPNLDSDTTPPGQERDAARRGNDPGDFVALPESFGSAHPGLRNVAKFQRLRVNGSSGPDTITVNDRVLIDFAEMDLRAYDPQTLIRDCEYLKQILERDPEGVREILAALQPNATTADLAKARQKVQQLGLTEDAAVTAGGGLIGILIVGGLAILGTAIVTGAIRAGAEAKYRIAVANATKS